MPSSVTESGPIPGPSPGQAPAVAAESLYLVNLLLAPGLGFLALLVLYLRSRRASPPLAAAHLAQTLAASLWAVVLLILVNALILVLGGYGGMHTWVVLILYFTIAHSTLVLFGVVGLAKAMAGQCWRYPLLGPRLPGNCPQRTAP